VLSLNGKVKPEEATRQQRVVALGMLLLVYAFNFLDRQILGILATPIRRISASAMRSSAHANRAAAAQITRLFSWLGAQKSSMLSLEWFVNVARQRAQSGK
jgi:hypothetical protein